MNDAARPPSVWDNLRLQDKLVVGAILAAGLTISFVVMSYLVYNPVLPFMGTTLVFSGIGISILIAIYYYQEYMKKRQRESNN
jgi:hypothetical protein